MPLIYTFQEKYVQVDNSECETNYFSYQDQRIAFDRHKLHISLNSAQFSLIIIPLIKLLQQVPLEEILAGFDVRDRFCRYSLKLFTSVVIPFAELLKQAVQDKTITAFKVLNSEYFLEVLNKRSFSDLRFDRAKNAQFTLYLHNTLSDQNLKDLLGLCGKIEKTLKGIAPGDKTVFCEADVSLSDHIRYRLTALSEMEYITAVDPRVELLGEMARKSEVVLYLTNGLAPKSPAVRQITSAPLAPFFGRKRHPSLPSAVESKSIQCSSTEIESKKPMVGKWRY